MFAGMFVVARPGISDEPILIDFSASVIAEFLSLIVHPTPPAHDDDFWVLEGLFRRPMTATRSWSRSAMPSTSPVKKSHSSSS
jgi:hypothetical protein